MAQLQIAGKMLKWTCRKFHPKVLVPIPGISSLETSTNPTLSVQQWTWAKPSKLWPLRTNLKIWISICIEIKIILRALNSTLIIRICHTTMKTLMPMLINSRLKMFNSILSMKKKLKPLTLTWKLWMKRSMMMREESRNKFSKMKLKASATIQLNSILTILTLIIRKDTINRFTVRICSETVKPRIQTRRFSTSELI
jgi:hypothetical protein